MNSEKVFKWISLISILNMVLLVVLSYELYIYNEHWTLREQAVNEVESMRVVQLQRAYIHICESDPMKAEPCLILNSRWYSNPANYPELADGTYNGWLFPPKAGTISDLPTPK